ncbi:MAG: hypothetical protein J3Q66DRAFT_153422 [Benniella sp.]|nr:MAG: hypothetical protein J3Q66DRAFT_153422 [Benniella sp.]
MPYFTFPPHTQFLLHIHSHILHLYILLLHCLIRSGAGSVPKRQGPTTPGLLALYLSTFTTSFHVQNTNEDNRFDERPFYTRHAIDP